MNNSLDLDCIDKLYDIFQTEKNSIMLDYKNDKELKNVLFNSQKLSLVEGMMKNLIKYRNIKLKAKLKDIL
jgi:hypothetical protein